MADDGDWFADTVDTADTQSQATSALGAETAQSKQAQGEEKVEASAEQKQSQIAEEEYLDPNKLILFKHWSRPKSLQYKYLYNYRYNYYDDVLDYLDKRQRGLYREVPHPQTWAERVLRTYNNKINKIESFRKLLEDTKLVTKTKISGIFQLHHTKNYINRRYSSILV